MKGVPPSPLCCAVVCVLRVKCCASDARAAVGINIVYSSLFSINLILPILNLSSLPSPFTVSLSHFLNYLFSLAYFLHSPLPSRLLFLFEVDHSCSLVASPKQYGSQR
jgi:hypothetical protein